MVCLWRRGWEEGAGGLLVCHSSPAVSLHANLESLADHACTAVLTADSALRALSGHVQFNVLQQSAPATALVCVATKHFHHGNLLAIGKVRGKLQAGRKEEGILSATLRGDPNLSHTVASTNSPFQGPP